MFKNENGFSLVQVMIAASIMGGLSLVFMQLTQNMNQSQLFAEGKSDELQLKSVVQMILDDERYCRVSLAGDGLVGNPLNPVVFEKIDVDEDGEGLDIALYVSNPDGDTRTIKKLNGENNPGTDDKSKFGKLTIKSLKLLMNNDNGLNNYTDSTSHSDIGIIRAVVSKKIARAKTRELTFDFDVKLSMSTGVSPEGSGETRIFSCSDSSGVVSDAELACQMANKFYDESSTPNCRASLGGINSLTSRGGNGGYPSNLSCPDGFGIVGVSGRSGSQIDALAVRCQEIDYESLIPIGNIVSSAQVGGTGGTSFSLSCPTGTFAIGLYGYANSILNRIGLRCASYDGSSSSNSSSSGGSSGSYFNDTCSSNTILREIFTHSGSRIDSIRGLCL